MKKIELIADIKKSINKVGGKMIDLANADIMALLAKMNGIELDFDYKKVMTLGTITLLGETEVIAITEDGLIISSDEEHENLVTIFYEDVSHRVLKRVKEYLDFVIY